MIESANVKEVYEELRQRGWIPKLDTLSRLLEHNDLRRLYDKARRTEPTAPVFWERWD